MDFGIKNVHHARVIVHVFYPFHLYFQGFAPSNVVNEFLFTLLQHLTCLLNLLLTQKHQHPNCQVKFFWILENSVINSMIHGALFQYFLLELQESFLNFNFIEEKGKEVSEGLLSSKSEQKNINPSSG